MYVCKIALLLLVATKFCCYWLPYCWAVFILTFYPFYRFTVASTDSLIFGISFLIWYIYTSFTCLGSWNTFASFYVVTYLNIYNTYVNTYNQCKRIYLFALHSTFSLANRIYLIQVYHCIVVNQNIWGIHSTFYTLCFSCILHAHSGIATTYQRTRQNKRVLIKNLTKQVEKSLVRV